MELLRLIGLFLWGIAKRLYWLIPSLFTDPLDFMERWFKVTYQPSPLLFWLLLSLGLGMAILLSYHELNEKNKRRKIRKTLGEFLEEGQQLQSQCSTYQKEPPPNEQAANWMKRTEEFLHTYLGDSYIARFRSNAGLSLTRGTAFFSSGSHRVLWVNIDYRLARLEEFLAEVRPASSI